MHQRHVKRFCGDGVHQSHVPGDGDHFRQNRTSSERQDASGHRADSENDSGSCGEGDPRHGAAEDDVRCVETHRQTGEFLGYRAVYSAEFSGTNVREAPFVHDALTSIEGVQSPTPVYHVDDGVEVHAAAFADAVGKAKAKFAAQCKGLGVDPNFYEVTTWTIQEDTPRGKTLSFQANATEPKAVGLEPGKATLDLNVTFVFAPKKPTP